MHGIVVAAQGLKCTGVKQMSILTGLAGILVLQRVEAAECCGVFRQSEMRFGETQQQIGVVTVHAAQATLIEFFRCTEIVPLQMLAGQCHGVLGGACERVLLACLAQRFIGIDSFGQAAPCVARAAGVSEFRQQFHDEIGEATDQREKHHDEHPDGVATGFDDVHHQRELDNDG